VDRGLIPSLGAWKRPAFYNQFGLSPIYDDWHPDIYRHFDPVRWADLIASTGADAFHVNSKDHSGHPHYRTELEEPHGGYGGRDALGEVLSLLHSRGIRVCVNQSVFFDHKLFMQHPDWRIRDSLGRDSKELGILGNRAGIVCMNSPYADLAKQQIAAFGAKYPVDALFFDMLWVWIPVCYCEYCRHLYRLESGQELPPGNDRNSTRFRAYAEWRNGRMRTFVTELVGAFKAVRPEGLVTFNSPRPHLPTPPLSTEDLVPLFDFLTGDPVQVGFSMAITGLTASAWHHMGASQPSVFCIGRFHGHEAQAVGMVPVERLKIVGALCLAHNSAYQLHDIVKPDGTFAEEPLKPISETFSFLNSRRRLVGGAKLSCVAIYVSESTRDYLYEGDPSAQLPMERHRAAEVYSTGVLQAYLAFQRHHIPVDAISKLSLSDLDQFHLLVLPDAECLSESDVDVIRQYTANGGKLLATRFSSCRDQAGRDRGNFALNDVFGVDLKGATSYPESYIRPNDDVCEDAGIIREPIGIRDPQALVQTRPGARVLGSVVLPYTDRRIDRDHWVSFFGSVPAIETDSPALVLNEYGSGVACYVSAHISSSDDGLWAFSPDEPRELLYALGRRLLGDIVPLQTSGHPCLDVTGYWQEEEHRYVVHLVNCQDESPVLPLRDIDVRLRLRSGFEVGAVVTDPDGATLPFLIDDGLLHFTVPQVDIHLGVIIS
jgi:hypothetical protein